MLDAHAGIAALAVHDIATLAHTDALVRAIDANAVSSNGAADADDVVFAH